MAKTEKELLKQQKENNSISAEETAELSDEEIAGVSGGLEVKGRTGVGKFAVLRPFARKAEKKNPEAVADGRNRETLE